MAHPVGKMIAPFKDFRMIRIYSVLSSSEHFYQLLAYWDELWICIEGRIELGRIGDFYSVGRIGFGASFKSNKCYTVIKLQIFQNAKSSI